jgi:excisionase family DNA binding protein
MPASLSANGKQWLTLTQAAKRIGVHAATLRRWADDGALPVMLTPGGHRRFSAEDVAAFAQAEHKNAPPSLPADSFVERALVQTRQEIVLNPEKPWLTAMAEDNRSRHRVLGRQLMGLTLQYISTDLVEEEMLLEARRLGHAYGQLSQTSGMDLTAALQAAMFFRDMIVETALETPVGAQKPANNVRLMRRINQLLNTVHLAIAETYAR